jgi:DNA-binding SARP family transcriptional activator
MTDMPGQAAFPLFRVFTCGALLVERWDGIAWQPLRLGEWGGSQDPRRLLRRLACSPERHARRGILLDDLWPEVDPKESGGYLNDAAYKLRAVLRPAKGKETLLITTEDASSFRLPGQDRLWIDADAALLHLEQAEAMKVTGADPLPLVEQAAAILARGAYLEEEEGLWAYGRRATMERAQRGCVLWQAQLYQQRGWAQRAQRLLCTHLEADPTDEDALCQLMELLHEQGRPSEGRRLYRDSQRAFAAEGMEPAVRTRDLAEHLGLDLRPVSKEPVLSVPTPSAFVFSPLDQEHILDLMKSRRQLLNDLLTLASTALVLAPYARLYPADGSEQSASAVVTSALDDLERITESYWRLCTNTSLDLLGNVSEHFQTITHLLKRVQPREVTRRLCQLAGETAQILGKTLFDLHEYTLAWAYYTFSLKAAQAAFNQDLWAVGLGRLSLLLIYWEHPGEALPLLQEAGQLTIGSARIRCWLAAVEAEAHAHLGDADACDRALTAAKALAASESLGEDRYATGFSPSRLAGYEGACFVRLCQPERALPALQQAVTLLDPQAIRRRSTLLTDMGIAQAQQGQVQQACTLAIQALAITTQTKSLSVLERVRLVRSELEPWKETDAVQDLEQRLDATFALITA